MKKLVSEPRESFNDPLVLWDSRTPLSFVQTSEQGKQQKKKHSNTLTHKHIHIYIYRYRHVLNIRHYTKRKVGFGHFSLHFITFANYSTPSLTNNNKFSRTFRQRHLRKWMNLCK